MHAGLATAATAAFVIALGSCNFDDSFQLHLQVDPGRPGPEFREACHESAVASCAYQERCRAYVFEARWPDRDTCEDRSTLACQIRATDPHARYDEAYVGDCKTPADFPCASDPAFDDALAAFREQCPLPEGDLPDGSACPTDGACRAGVCAMNVPTATSLCGTCGSPCADCTEDERCEILASGTVSCKTPVDVGGPCSDNSDCTTLSCKSGACAPRANEGEPCDHPFALCGDLNDGVNDYCDPSTMLCTRIALAKAGELCGNLASGFTLCGGGGSCPTGGSTATCVGPAPDGSLCDPTQGLDCLEPAACVDGFCRFHAVSCPETG